MCRCIIERVTGFDAHRGFAPRRVGYPPVMTGNAMEGLLRAESWFFPGYAKKRSGHSLLPCQKNMIEQ
jgi:hypothetical protein